MQSTLKTIEKKNSHFHIHSCDFCQFPVIPVAFVGSSLVLSPTIYSFSIFIRQAVHRVACNLVSDVPHRKQCQVWKRLSKLEARAFGTLIGYVGYCNMGHVCHKQVIRSRLILGLRLCKDMCRIVGIFGSHLRNCLLQKRELAIFIVCFWDIPNNFQELLLALDSRIIPACVWEPYGMQGIDPWLVNAK